jgi:tetratricopeptide (TPR) repeat protein
LADGESSMAGRRTEMSGVTTRALATRWVYLIVMMLAVLPYLSALTNPLLYDAPATIERNATVQSGALSELFQVDFWGDPLDADYSTRSYRPLVSMTYALQVRAGAGPLAFHLFDLALHAIAALLVVLLIEGSGVTRAWALAGGAVFAVHPVQTEAVASIVGRADLMAGLCLFAALLMAQRAHRASRPPLDRAVALVLLAAALLCKEYAVIFPFMLIAVDLLRRRGERDRASPPVIFWSSAIVLVVAYLALRYNLIGAIGGVASLGEVDHPLYGAPLSTLLAMALRIVLLAARLLVLPVWLNHHYRVGTLEIIETVWHPLALAGAALLTLSTLGAWWCWHRRAEPTPAVAYVLLWFPLLPTLNLVSLAGVVFAERFLYVPVAGLSLLLAWTLERLVRDAPGRRRVAVVGLAGLLLTFGTLAARRVADWSSEERLARSSLRVYPDGAEVWRGLGLVLGSSGDDEQALAAFERSLGIEPRAPQTLQAYATALVNLGRYDEGADAWRRCIEATPGEAGVLWLGLGQAELLAGEAITAHEALERANALLPGHPGIVPARAEAMLRLAAIRLEEGDRAGALQWVARVESLGRLSPGFLLRVGGIAWGAGDETRGRTRLEQALSLSADAPRHEYERALALERTGRLDEAIVAYRTLLAVRPEHPETLFNLGRVLLSAGRPAAAAEALRRGLDVQHDPRAQQLLERALSQRQ